MLKTHFSFQPFQLYFFYPFDIIILSKKKKKQFQFDCLSGNVKYLNFISKIIYHRNFMFSRLFVIVVNDVIENLVAEEE